jgi:hypothetical protein
MEYLHPSSGWTTLQSYIREHREIKIDTEHPGLVKVAQDNEGEEGRPW